MSVYPSNLDTTFPGYPYTDYIEYLDADQANAWVEGIIALEETIGYGTAGTPNNPLYSQVYNIIFPTITARIAALELIVSEEPVINTQDNIIQSVGTANRAGNTGMTADAGHVHMGPVIIQVPIGGIILWPAEVVPNASLPSNFMALNQQPPNNALPTGSYPQLFNLLGYKYGNYNGGANFGVPVMIDRSPVGPGGIWSNDVGQYGGANNISLSNMPQHSHYTYDAGHHHQSYIEDGATGDMTRFQGIYTDPGSTLSLVTSNAPYAGLPATWSPADPGEGQGPILPGYPPDIGHQNHWKTDYANIGTTNVGSGTNFNTPYCGLHYLMRII